MRATTCPTGRLSAWPWTYLDRCTGSRCLVPTHASPPFLSPTHERHGRPAHAAAVQSALRRFTLPDDTPLPYFGGLSCQWVMLDEPID